MSFAKLLKKPVVTEKTSILMEKNKYVFEVASNASKEAIASAVKEIYGVTPLRVNVLKNGPKTKRSWVGKRGQFVKAEVKKAIITLNEKDTINLYKEEKK